MLMAAIRRLRERWRIRRERKQRLNAARYEPTGKREMNPWEGSGGGL
jgi:hypothetical protein